MQRRNFLKGLIALPFAPLIPIATAVPPEPPCGFVIHRVYTSQESLDDIRAWGVDSIDDKTKKQLILEGW